MPASAGACARPCRSALRRFRAPCVPVRPATAPLPRAPRQRRPPPAGHLPCGDALLPARPAPPSAPAPRPAPPLRLRAPAPRDSWAALHSGPRPPRQHWRGRALPHLWSGVPAAGEAGWCRGPTGVHGWRPVSPSAPSSTPAHHPAQIWPSLSSLLPASLALLPCTSRALVRPSPPARHAEKRNEAAPDHREQTAKRRHG